VDAAGAAAALGDGIFRIEFRINLLSLTPAEAAEAAAGVGGFTMPGEVVANGRDGREDAPPAPEAEVAAPVPAPVPGPLLDERLKEFKTFRMV
jgi:hypothetical protein